MNHTLTTETDNIHQFVQQLQSEDGGCRRAAAESLAEISDPRGIYPLIRALYDENLGVQQAALDALSRIDGELTVYCTLPLLRDDSAAIRNMGVEILQKTGPSAMRLLVTALGDRDPDVRKMIADIMATLQDPATVDPLLRAMRDPNSNVRSAAATALGCLADDRAVETLMEALKDEEWVAFFSAGALGRIRDRRATLALIEIIQPGNSAVSMTVQLAALDAIGEIGDPEAVDPLLSTLNTCYPTLRESIVKTLLKLSQYNMEALIDRVEQDTFFQILRECYRDTDLDMYGTVIHAFNLLGNPDGVQPVLDLASELAIEDPEVLQTVLQTLMHLKHETILIKNLASEVPKRAHLATKVLGMMKSHQAVLPLISIFDGAETELQVEVLLSLGEIGGDDGMKFLISCLSADVGNVRKAATRGLGKIGRQEAIGPIIDRLQNEEYRDVISEMVKSLMTLGREIGVGTILESLVTLMGHPNANIREAVAKGLGQTNQPEGLRALLQGINDSDAKVRKASIDSIGRHGGSDGTEAIIVATCDEKEEVRMAAIQALEGRRRFLSREDDSERVMKALLMSLQDVHIRVRCRAAEALGRWGDRSAIPSLIEVLQHGSSPIQLMAIMALGELRAKEAEGILRMAASHQDREISQAATEALAKVAE